jgi:hypothetical protein
VQIVSLGWTASRIERTIKHGLFLLLACAVASGMRLSRVGASRPYQLLQTPPRRSVAIRRGGRVIRTTRLEILTMLLDDVLEPAMRGALGRAAECEPAVQWARRAIDALASERDAAAVALGLPTGWAIKQHVFAKLQAEIGMDLPTQRRGEPAPATPELEELALLAILEADVLDDDVRRFLLQEITGTPWSMADVYFPDPEALSAVAQRVPPRGALGPAGPIYEALCRPADHPDDRFLCADWDGVHDLRPEPPEPQPEARRPATRIQRLMERLTQATRSTAATARAPTSPPPP